MNLQTERIGQFCKQLKLERVSAEYAAAAQSAVRDEASFADFLEGLLKVADSMDRCNTAMITLGWSFKAEGLSRSLVEPSRDGI